MIKRISVFILILFLLGIIAVYLPEIKLNSLTGEVIETIYEKEEVFVKRVIDGDTFESNKGMVRLLGINTPEKGKVYYKEAKDFLKQIENKTVFILRDFEDIDKYDRKLRYVFYKNELINVKILENGLGSSFMLDDLEYEKKLKNSENFAMDNGFGLWEKSLDVCVDCVKLIKLDEKEEYFILENKCDFDCDLKGWLVKDDANHFFKLNNLKKYENEKFNSKTSVWNNNGDRFFMFDDKGGLVIFYEY